jgi:hypothetical protein
MNIEIGTGFRTRLVLSKAPRTAVKTNEGKYLRYYSYGAYEVIVPKKGVHAVIPKNLLNKSVFNKDITLAKHQNLHNLLWGNK